jgi:hypothetical protein
VRRRLILWLALTGIAVGGAAAATLVLSRWLATGETPAGIDAPVVPAEPRIKVRLFYVSDDGLRLVPAEREVPFAETTLEQARRIVEAQLEPAPSPFVSAIPPGTTLRSVFLTQSGQAFVDLSREVAASHPGGALNEILTVYAIVDALTTNLPALAGVQILVDGRQVDTLAGHVDLRRPLGKSTFWVEDPGTAPASVAPTSPAAGRGTPDATSPVPIR